MVLRKKKTLTILHGLILSTSYLFIGTGIGIKLSQLALPWGFPLILMGVLILLPALAWLFKKEQKV